MPTTGCKRNRTVLEENIAKKKKKEHNKTKHNEKAESINNMTRELEGLEDRPKAEIHINLLKTILKKIKLENART